MATISSTLAFPSLQQPQLQSVRKKQQRPSTRRFSVCPINASVSEKPSPGAGVSLPESTNLPIREIPGDYGPFLIGPIKDRLDYFYNQGRDEFFNSKIQKYQSTVLRTNMIPGPFVAPNPQVVALLDGKSFPVLFDVTKVEKKDLFTGTYMPSTELTGGYRILSYLDPSEPNHGKLKNLLFYQLKSRRDHVIPEFISCYNELFDSVEKEIATEGKANFGSANDQATFNFLARSLYGTNPASTKLRNDGPDLISNWVLFQLAPQLTLGLPKYLEELTIHSFRLPPALIKGDYQRLYDFFYSSSGFLLDEAEKLGISREEACHNLLFATCFNSFGGLKLLFPSTLKWLDGGGAKFQSELAQEIRSAIRSNGGKVTMAAMERMPLMKSVVYEALRIEPPVPLQFGRVKRDMIIESHDAAFKVKAGELLFGFQPFATKDPKIFERPEEFVPDRFVGEGEKMLKHVFWSNGRETENTTVENKQCAGKDFVVLACRLFVVEFFLRYDSFEIEVGKATLGASITVTSLKRANV